MASVLELILRSKKKGTGVKDTTKELGGLEKLAKKVTVAFIAMAAAKVIKSSALLAARVETLAIVTKVLGKNVGLTEEGVRSLEKSIVAQGITLQASRQAIAMMIQANVDLAHSTDLARLAQDTAVIANVNSSEAFQKLVYVLQTGNVRMARTLGLNVQFGKAQRELAQELGKTTDELTDQEIMQARTNAVMKSGERIAGTYEAAMETAGKKLLSMDRQVEELSRIFGEMFLPILGETVDMLYEAAKAILNAREAAKDHEESVDELTQSYIAGTVSERDFIAGLQDEQRALQDAKEGAGFLEGALLTLQQARITGILIYKEEALVGKESIDVRREEARWINHWTEALYAAYHGISLLTEAEEEALTTTQRLQQQFDEAKVAIEGATGAIEELTASQYYLLAAEALQEKGGIQAALGYWALAEGAVAAKAKIDALILTMQIAGGMTMAAGGAPMWAEIPSYEQPGFVPVGASAAATEKARKIALWDAAHPSGVDSEGRGNPYRQHGGPVKAGQSYIVGEAGSEVFVPRQDGHIYNQQQLAGGDININTGISQRAFNNMAEDWMRGLGG